VASVFKSPGAKKWTILYFDENGVRRKKTGAPDKAVTERIAADIENRVALRRDGLIDPAAERRAAHERTPLKAHLEAYRAALRAKGNTEKHTETFVSRAARVLNRAGVSRLSEMTPARVQEALAALRAAGLSPATVNHHRNAVRGFSRWCWKDGRTVAETLTGVTPYNAEADRRHDRRTLAPDELARLIRAAHEGPTHRRMTGPARALCYRLAVASGLRFAEIKSLTVASFDLKGDRPAVTVLAAYSKNGQTATLPLPADVADDLEVYLSALPPGAAAFPLPGRGADMLKIDLAAAGLPYRDGAGRVFDFHSLRCQLATLADRAGVSPRTVQRLMRHSTLALTDRYTRPRAADLDAAAEALPSFRPGPRNAEAARATGTDDAGALHAIGATDAEDGIGLYEPNGIEGNAVTTSSPQVVTGNHNPRVGGSSPSAATHVKQRHLVTGGAKLHKTHGLRASPHVDVLRDVAARG
jgi:integrase